MSFFFRVGVHCHVLMCTVKNMVRRREKVEMTTNRPEFLRASEVTWSLYCYYVRQKGTCSALHNVQEGGIRRPPRRA